MEKKRYYVSVQACSLLTDQNVAPYEWTIEATPQEAGELLRMMKQIAEKAESTFLAFTYPWPDTPEEEVNVGYQQQLDDVYRDIYRLGTEETRNGLAKYLESI